MKSIFSALLFVLAFGSISYAQNQVVDPRPQATVYVIDPQSGQETPDGSDLAIMFKNSVIDLVNNTYRSKAILRGAVPQSQGRVYTITQMGADSHVNGFQVSLDYPTSDPNNPNNVYTFAYHTDDNTLYYFNPRTQQWQQERIVGQNVYNHRKTSGYAQRFEEELASQGGAPAEASADLDAPVDADVTADAPPPAMPEYEQPECPTAGYLWQPGYWAYSPNRGDYYFVPGAWVAPPNPGLLWTPPYWGYEGARYIFHIGYWGDHVGFYGGINYGFGYGGRGYYGGEWRGGRFAYNTAVVRVNVRVVHNTYINKTVINNVTVNNHNSFNGRGGVEAKPTAEELSAQREKHIKPTREQIGNQLQARNNPNQFHKTNPGGKPVFANPKAAPYKPQNGPGIKGGNNLKQPIPPVKPGGKPGNPAKPDGKPANPTKPDVTPTNPGEKPANPTKPDGKPENPNKPDGKPANPTRPDVTPTNPGEKPVNPAKPNEKPVNPPKPAGPARPPVRPASPAKTHNQPNTPVRPQHNQPGNPGKGKPANPPKHEKPKENPPAKQQ